MNNLSDRLFDLLRVLGEVRLPWSRRGRGSPLPPAFDYWGWSGLPRERASFRMGLGQAAQRLDVSVKSRAPLGIGLVLWKRDSRLGEPRERVVLPEALGGAYRATSREPKLCARLFTQEIIDRLLTVAENADSVEIRDDGAQLGFNVFHGGFDAGKKRALAGLHPIVELLDQLQEQRARLPRSDHAPELARVWAELARRRDGEFSDSAERLSLPTEHGELQVCVVDVARRHGTLLQLGFIQPLPIQFEVCEREELGWAERLRAPMLAGPDPDAALYVRGGRDRAGAAVGREAERALVELRAASESVHLSRSALVSRHDHVLVDPDELEQAVDLMLATAGTLCSAHKRAAGPYR